MKKLISITLSFLMMLMVVIPSNAMNNGIKDATVQKYEWEETDDYIILWTEIEKDTVLVDLLLKKSPDIVYQWVEGKNAANDNAKRIINAEEEELRNICIQGVEVFDIQEESAEDLPLRASNPYEVLAVTERLEELYGTPRTWALVATNSYSYSPLTIRIREDDMVDAEKWGMETLPAGITYAAAAVGLASAFGLGVPVAIEMLTLFIDVYNATATLVESLTVNQYRGVYLTQRTGTVQPQNGTETPVVTATRSYIRYFYFGKTPTTPNAADNMYEMDLTETAFYPSEYDYRTNVMIQAAYQQYVG